MDQRKKETDQNRESEDNTQKVDTGAGKKQRRRSGKKRILLGIGIAVCVLIAAVCATYVVLRESGKLALLRYAQNLTPNVEDGSATTLLDDNAVQYQGKTYYYNEDIVTLLVMGIDRDELEERTDEAGEGGRADALFLVVLDNKNKNMSIIAVNRDTMTDIQVQDYYGDTRGKTTQQLALAYAYGDGLEQSCQQTVDAVSNLFYDTPIHGYCALDMDAIPALNDAVGGVAVTVLDDFTDYDASMKKGSTVTLSGEQALRYIRARSSVGTGDNLSRMARQKQYLQAYIAAAKQKAQSDITLPLTLYNELSGHMITNIGLSQVTYLTTQILNTQFDADRFYTLEGTSKQGALFMEFYPDETKLYELILDIFYTCGEEDDATISQ